MKNFLLLLGTQKCGTTWLSNQLNLHPEFQSCKIKEWRSIGKATEFSQNSRDKCPKLFFLKQEFWFSLNTKQKRMFASANLNNYLSIQTSSLLWDKNKNLILTKSDLLNERNYGDLVGLNKEETAKKYGDEQVHKWRRSFNISPPGGESLEDVVIRVKPYFEKTIKPLMDNKNILIAAHGNSLRALLISLGEDLFSII